MTHFLIRLAQPLLALLILTTAVLCDEPAPEMAAARKAAAELLPKLETGGWVASEAAFQTINQLARSKDQADKDLSDKLVDLCATSIAQGFKELPAPPAREQLLWDAETLTHALLDNPTPAHLSHAREIVASWEKALPQSVEARLLRLQLLVTDQKRAEQITLAAALVGEKELSAPNRAYVRDVYVGALLRGDPSSAEEIERARSVLQDWLKEEPQGPRPRLLLLELHHAKREWQALYVLATELLADEKITGPDRLYAHHCRLEGALNTGKTQELNDADWNYMMEQLTGGKGLKKFIDEHGQLLAGIALGIGWLWLLIVAFITRSLRSKPPGFWMVILWSTVILYGSSVILAPMVLCVSFSLLGIMFLIFATTGSRAPLGYLVAPQAATESGKARWPAILGWCVLAFLLIELFNLGYAWAFEQVMDRELDSQLVAKLLQADSLPKLLGMVIAGGIFVPFLEEVVFRGMLQDWMGRRLRAGWCVALVSIIFGIVHGLEMAIPITVIGVALSLLRLRFRSLLPCILLHGLNNSVMIVLLYYFPHLV
ncbi:lysostaphin resistance A-like protein [Prosthecobacter sp.]|uniref:lysostaphin resistance A-like protein n=1 Tax=Prosthecobacter sp. TaxID=1965333 RepID=UPI0037852055